MTATARPTFAVAGTIDIKVLDAAAAAGKVRVFAILCDVSTLDATLIEIQMLNTIPQYNK